MNRKNGFWIALWVVLVVITGFLAFGYGPGGMGYGPPHGWGRMGTWGDAYREDGAQGWYGMGPGMMGGSGYGMQPGAGGGYGPGMMGQYGGGMPWMGAGMGPGMAGSYTMMPWAPPGLTSEQVQKIGQLQTESAARNRGLMQQAWEVQARLNGLYTADKRDWNEIRTASRTLFDLQRQQMDAMIDMQQKIDGLLTDSQRQEISRAWRGYGWMGAN